MNNSGSNRYVYLRSITNYRNLAKKGRGDIVTRSDEAFGSSNYAEYFVQRKPEGRYKLARTLVVLTYILIPLIIVTILAFISPMLMTVGALFPLFIWMAVHFTWLFVSQAFFYSVDSSVFTLVKVYGGRKEREMLSVKVKNFSVIAPYSDRIKATIADSALKNGATKIFAASSMNAEDLYFGVCNIDGYEVVVFFEATEQLLKALKYYNSEAVTVTKTRR